MIGSINSSVSLPSRYIDFSLKTRHTDTKLSRYTIQFKTKIAVRVEVQLIWQRPKWKTYPGPTRCIHVSMWRFWTFWLMSGGSGYSPETMNRTIAFVAISILSQTRVKMTFHYKTTRWITDKHTARRLLRYIRRIQTVVFCPLYISGKSMQLHQVGK